MKIDLITLSKIGLSAKYTVRGPLGWTTPIHVAQDHHRPTSVGPEWLILTYVTFLKVEVSGVFNLRAPALALCQVCSWDTFWRQHQSQTLENIPQEPVWGATGKCSGHPSAGGWLPSARGRCCTSSGAQVHPTFVAFPFSDGAIPASAGHRRLSRGQKWLVATGGGWGDMGQCERNLTKFQIKKVNENNGEAAIAEVALLVFGGEDGSFVVFYN